MNLKEVAHQLQISQVKVNNIAMTVFGSLPQDFSEEQVRELRNYLAMSGENAPQLLAGVEEKINSELAEASPVHELHAQLQKITQQPEKLARIREIVGSRKYSQNLQLWQAFVTFQLRKSLVDQQHALIEFKRTAKEQVANIYSELGHEMLTEIRQSTTSMVDMLRMENEQFLQAFDKINLEANISNSVYEQRLREAVDQLIELG